MSGFWEALTTRVPPPEPWLLAVVVAAVVAIVWGPTGRWVRPVVTMAHEGGHALVALLVGRRLRGVRLHADASGLTLSRGRPSGPGMVITALAGYPGPSFLGLAAAVLLRFGFATATVWLYVALLAALLLAIRNWFGAFAVLLAAASLVAVTLRFPTAQVVAAYAVTALLLVGAMRAAWELLAGQRQLRRGHSDAQLLAELTRVPAAVFECLFLMVTLGALAGSAWLLWPLDAGG